MLLTTFLYFICTIQIFNLLAFLKVLMLRYICANKRRLKCFKMIFGACFIVLLYCFLRIKNKNVKFFLKCFLYDKKP